MAVFRPIKPPKPIEINEWLGVNESVGDTEIRLGEAVRQENFRITKNKKPQKRPGHHVYIDSNTPIQGAWYGNLTGENTLLFITDNVLYVRYTDIQTSETTLEGLLSSAWNDSNFWDDAEIWDEAANPPVVQIGPVTAGSPPFDAKYEFLFFGGVLLIKSQYNYYQLTSALSLSQVTAYVPTVIIASTPAGVGTAFERINLLTNAKKQQYIAAGSATLYQLAETNIVNGSVIVTVNDVVVSNYTVNNALGQVTFTVAPANGAIVVIQWTKGTGDNLALFNTFRFMTDYGLGNDTNLIMFGSSELTAKNAFIYSHPGNYAYFASTSIVRVGTNQHAITDLVAQYNSLVVFKETSAAIVNPQSNPEYADNTGLHPWEFPYRELNESVGNIAPKMVQLVENNPVSLYGSSMWLWSSATGVEDERNAKIISDRYKLSLQQQDLRTAVTFDYQDQKEYWCAVGGKVFIWNYGNDTMYSYTNVTASQILAVADGIAFIDEFKVNLFKEGNKADRAVLGDSIPCKLYGGFSDFGSLEYRKIMRKEWVAISPSAKTSVTVKFVTDRTQEIAAKTFKVKYNLWSFNSVNFNDVSFRTNPNPQPNRQDTKVKKFTYLQYILENDTNNEDLTVLKLLLQAQTQGLSK